MSRATHGVIHIAKHFHSRLQKVLNQILIVNQLEAVNCQFVKCCLFDDVRVKSIVRRRMIRQVQAGGRGSADIRG
jgi:translation initiation factor 2 beta subunit (eIF-2beta)/eIF-5